MLDFLEVSERNTKGVIEIFPDFLAISSKHLMIRGGDFYAIWVAELNRWSTSREEAIQVIDNALYSHAKKYADTGIPYRVLCLKNTTNKMIDKWNHYLKNQMWDNYVELDQKVISNNAETTLEDYSTFRLSYSIGPGEHPAWDKLVGGLYSEADKHKIMFWTGATLLGEVKKHQKCLVFYGTGGTGKSTIFRKLESILERYASTADISALGENDPFSLESFAEGSLMFIQDDGDLSNIEKNHLLNSVISHETVWVNVKHKSRYKTKYNALLVMGTNKPVHITDAKSGIIRRLIDVRPTGYIFPIEEYERLNAQIEFELGAIAYDCIQLYKENPHYYDKYIPVEMIGESNDFYNFILERGYDEFAQNDGVTLNRAWALWNDYAEDAKLKRINKTAFKVELKSYFKQFDERTTVNGKRVYNYFSGFIQDKFSTFKPQIEPNRASDNESWLIFEDVVVDNQFEKIFADCKAQYVAAEDEKKPRKSWDKVYTKLKDIDTRQLHYVLPPKDTTLITVDFDLRDAQGNKSYEMNYIAASMFPPTYAELSKSGGGIHLEYFYDGDVSMLDSDYAEHIEIKVYTGLSSLRRKLTKCNRLPVNKISSNLPLKKEGVKKVYSKEVLNVNKGLRTSIEMALRKEVPNVVPHTAPCINFIYDILEKAYNSGVAYNVEDLGKDIFMFAIKSSNQKQQCINKVSKMHLKSKDELIEIASNEKPLVIFDVEVYKNFFCIVYCTLDGPIVRMVNPTPEEVAFFIENYALVGFNNRKYDNHIIYARAYKRYDNMQLYLLSKEIIDDHTGFIPPAYGISETDIFDFAAKKQGLKKWEIEYHLPHKEMDISWDEPVPEERMDDVVVYCVNDVLATREVFKRLQGDWEARQALAKIAKARAGYSTNNDKTNNLTQRLVFGKKKNPQSGFYWRNLAEPVNVVPAPMLSFLKDIGTIKNVVEDTDFVAWDGTHSKLPCHPGYKFEFITEEIVDENGETYLVRVPHSTYRGLEVGEGGFVWAAHGMYSNVWTFDVTSMHPHTVANNFAFGEDTKNFWDILQARVGIKHGEFEKVESMMDGAFKGFLNEESRKPISQALKIAINATYGQTAASYNNPFKDPNNIDNFIAKGGALFMVDLLLSLLDKGAQVVHVKTDSIKVVAPTQEIVNYIYDFGYRYGYHFEIEHKFERFCLVNNAVYIAKLSEDDEEWLDECKSAKKAAEKTGGVYVEPTRWTATGAQFAHPYVFKTLFSGEELSFYDYCETKNVKTKMYLDMNEGCPEDEHHYVFVGGTGSFVPIKPGCGGGLLVKDQDGKMNAVTGTKGYRWMEEETLRNDIHAEEMIDKTYFIDLANEAIASINEWGDFEKFASGEDISPVVEEKEPLPWD